MVCAYMYARSHWVYAEMLIMCCQSLACAWVYNTSVGIAARIWCKLMPPDFYIACKMGPRAPLERRSCVNSV